jgi:hypothetical protein
MSSALLCASFMLAASPVYGASLDYEAGKMFRKIGIGPEQAEPYALVYEEFLKSRNSQVRRALKIRPGESSRSWRRSALVARQKNQLRRWARC